MNATLHPPSPHARGERRCYRNKAALLFSYLLMAAVLGACATQPALDTSAVSRQISPQSYVQEDPPQPGVVNWGGKIIALNHLDEVTELEVLAFPLDSRGIPDAGGQSQGRFIARVKGFLEPEDYKPDRHVVLVGQLAGSKPGKVDQSDYSYALLQADQIRLIIPRGRNRILPYFSIGVGVSL